MQEINLQEILSLIFLIFVLISFGILRKGFGGLITEIFQASVNFNMISRYAESSSLLAKKFLNTSVIYFYIGVGMFFYYSIYFNFVMFHFDYVGLLAKIIVVIFLYKIFKQMIYRILGSITNNKAEAKVLSYADYILSSAAGYIIILPISLLPFLPESFARVVIIFSCIVAGLFYLLKIFYGIKLVIGKMPFLHILLLILTLEVLPIIAGVKYFSHIQF